MMKKIKGILFDLGWTLEVPASGSWMYTNRFYDYVPKEKFEAIDLVTRQEANQKAYQPLADHHHVLTLEEEYEQMIGYYSDLSRYLNLGLSQEMCREIAEDRTWNWDNYILFPDTLSTLKTLKEMGYRIGVLSDTWPSTVPQQKAAGAYEYYDCLTLSFELGVLKPDPRMYEDAIAKMKLPPQEILYADDLIKSLAKAETYGIQCVRSIAETPDVTDSHYPCVKSPGGVLKLLENNLL